MCRFSTRRQQTTSRLLNTTRADTRQSFVPTAGRGAAAREQAKMNSSSHNQALTVGASKSRALLLAISAGAFFIHIFVGVKDGFSGDGGINNNDVGQHSVRRRRASETALSSTDSSAVTAISLIGERHSGTNWITDHLQR